jgi:hypothetical protein
MLVTAAQIGINVFLFWRPYDGVRQTVPLSILGLTQGAHT